MNVRNLSPDERRELYESVLLVALRLTRSRAAAEDLTQSAFERLGTTRPWDSSRPTTLKQHLFGILKSLLSHERGAEARRGEYERQAGVEHAASSDADRSPETISLDRARRERAEALARRRIAALRAKVAEFELDLSILDLMSEEITKRADLVLRTGRSADEVKTALARIRRHMDSIIAAERGEEDEVA